MFNEKNYNQKMDKTFEIFTKELSSLRTGRANSKMLDLVKVDVYGQKMSINQLATITTPDSQTITIQPFDLSSLASIEKAIATSDLGFTPNNDGKIIRINVPPLTEERRKEFCKLASKYAEEGKVALRNIRREAIDRVKKSEKDGDLSEDQSRDEQETIQKETDNFIKDIEKKLSEKEAEILKV